MSITISKAVQRILKRDIPSSDCDEMKSNGIYYFPDEASVLHGLALVVGPEKTPYHGGYWFFSVQFSDQHPFEPPKVLTLTQDGRTRFNPNMYREGKVCLSLLGTWHQGDKWSSIQTLGSVLLSILGMVLTEEPLRNEPAYSEIKSHPSFNPYNRMVFHANVETLLRFLTEPPSFVPSNHRETICKVMAEHFEKNRIGLEAECRRLAVEWDDKYEKSGVFDMAQKYSFGKLADRIKTFKS